MLLQSIELKNLLSFRDAELELRALNVLIGANASGKSNLLAGDIDALSRYYRRDLTDALRGNPNVEEIPKKDVLARLKAATDGRYHKTKDAPHILRSIRPQRVKQAAPNCRRLFDRFLSGGYRSPQL